MKIIKNNEKYFRMQDIVLLNENFRLQTNNIAEQEEFKYYKKYD